MTKKSFFLILKNGLTIVDRNILPSFQGKIWISLLLVYQIWITTGLIKRWMDGLLTFPVLTWVLRAHCLIISLWTWIDICWNFISIIGTTLIYLIYVVLFWVFIHLFKIIFFTFNFLGVFFFNLDLDRTQIA